MNLEGLIARRRHLHQYPELSLQEHETQQYVEQELSKMGIASRRLAGTGVMARLGPGTGPAIAFRADTDALPVQEVSEKEYRSQREGVMHACGHDGHVAILLTVAEFWKEKESSLRLGVVLLFQPAEEGHHGARLMVDDGCMESVERVYAIHLWNTLAVGQVGLSLGPVMANSDRFKINIVGKGGHGSMPHDCRDPILAQASLILLVQQIASRNTNPTEGVVVSFGGVQSISFVPNVIPQSVSLCGTVRCYHEHIREATELRLQEICKGVALSHNVTIECVYTRGYNAVVNDNPATDDVISAASKLPNVSVVAAPKVMSGEDFYYYARGGAVTSCFCFVGSAIDDGILRPHHSPEFDIDERSLEIACNIFSEVIKMKAT